MDEGVTGGAQGAEQNGKLRDDAGDGAGDGDAEGAGPAIGPGRMLVIVGGVISIAVGVMRLADRPTAHFEVIEPPPMGVSAGVAVTTTSIRGEAAERAPTETERALAGTWVARVGSEAPQWASADGLVASLDGLQHGAVQPLERCLWIELYENLRGFQHACAVVAGEPSVLGGNDLLTGRQTDVGASLSWALEGRALTLRYDEDLTVGPNRLREVALALPAGTSPFAVTMSFPGHDAIPAQTHSFEAYPGRYLGDPGN